MFHFFFYWESGVNLNANRGGGYTSMSTSSSYVQRSQSNLENHEKLDKIEKSLFYIASSRSNYATIDASRVRAHGDGLLRAYRNEKATFTVDTREGGKIYFKIIIFDFMIDYFCFLFCLFIKVMVC